jgi:hypothetical protein
MLFVTSDQAHSAAINWQNDAEVGNQPGAGEPVVNCTYTSGPGLRLSLTSTPDSMHRMTARERVRFFLSFIGHL